VLNQAQEQLSIYFVFTKFKFLSFYMNMEGNVSLNVQINQFMSIWNNNRKLDLKKI